MLNQADIENTLLKHIHPFLRNSPVITQLNQRNYEEDLPYLIFVIPDSILGLVPSLKDTSLLSLAKLNQSELEVPSDLISLWIEVSQLIETSRIIGNNDALTHRK